MKYQTSDNSILLPYVQPGITAFIGGGGKTTLLRRLAGELTAERAATGDKTNTVILCTSTHIFPFEEFPCLDLPALNNADARHAQHIPHTNPAEQIRAMLTHCPVLCLGIREAATGKYTSPEPVISWQKLAGLADYVLVEADGSKRHPFKAHAPHEPVIPEGTGCVIYVAGAAGLGKPISEAVHRPELFCAQNGTASADAVPGSGKVPASGLVLTPDRILTPELAAAHILREIQTGRCPADLVILTGAGSTEQSARFADVLKGGLPGRSLLPLSIPLLFL